MGHPKAFRRFLLGFLSAALFATPIAVSASPQPFDLQIDLGGLAYYTTEVPFKDLMAQHTEWTARPTVWQGTCNPVAVDSQGYPTQALAGTGCMYTMWLMLHMPDPPPGAPYRWPSGHYVLTYNGSGNVQVPVNGVTSNVTYPSNNRIEFDVNNPGDLFTLEIHETNPADHVRDMRVFLKSDESTIDSQPFRQEFLNQLAPYKILRFMDWSGVSSSMFADSNSNWWNTGGPIATDASTIVLPSNASSVNNAYANDVWSGTGGTVLISSYDGATRTAHLSNPLSTTGALSGGIYDFPNRTWDKRVSTSMYDQDGPRGIAYEYMVKLANTLNKDMWINIPTAASDDYVLNLANYLKANLNPNLKIYIEYSNETWNFSYPGYMYSWAMTQKMNIPGNVWVGGDQWHPYRAIQIFHIFNQVFGQPDLRANRTASTDRLVRMIATQTGWVDRAKGQIDWMMPNGAAPTYGHPAYEYADAWAVTDYWDFPDRLTQAPGTDRNVLQTNTPADQFFPLQKEAIAERMASSSGQYNSNWLYQIATLAQARGLKVNVYEGGVGFIQQDGNQTTIDKITGVMRDPRMEDVQGYAINKWIEFSQMFPGTIGNFAVFGDVGSYSKYGWWSTLESVFQTPGNVPRYKGILDYVNGTLPALGTVTPVSPTPPPPPPPPPTTPPPPPTTTPVGPTGYTFCANEGGTCSFSGTVSVAYGANTAFSYLTLSNGTACNNTVFGDPAVGTVKACFTKSSTVTPPPPTTPPPPPPPTPSPSTFSIGTKVKTTANLNVRNKANTKSGKILCIQPAGSLGTIKQGPQTNQGYTWWNIDFNTGCDGWSVQSYLTTSIAYAPESQSASAATSIEELTSLIAKLQEILKGLQH